VSLILVTGASTGLGQATVDALVRDGHDVVLHARSEDRVEDAGVLDRVAATAYADLSDLDATAGLARELDGIGRFDAVIHNAGTMDRSLAVAVNVVAPYVLTTLMEPPARTIVLSSGMHRSGSTRLARSGLLRQQALGHGTHDGAGQDPALDAGPRRRPGLGADPYGRRRST
jgi:NAD(P)-dependent dehydrogenase (short-subunit alcohol dehydrogenase family)